MSEAESLLRAVAAAPDDDLPRLVYADWLEENGRAERAAFIRAQVTAARAGELTAEGLEAKRRAERLHRHHGATWPGERPAALSAAEPGRKPTPARGFAEEASVALGGWGEVHHAFTAAMDEYPVRAIRVCVDSLSGGGDGWRDRAKLANSPVWGRVAGVTIRPPLLGLSAADAATLGRFLDALAANKHAAGLSAFAAQGLPPAMFDRIARRGLFAGLRSLTWRRVTRDEPLRHPAAPDRGHDWPELREVNFAGNELDADAAFGWLATETGRRVESIDLSANPLGGDPHLARGLPPRRLKIDRRPNGARGWLTQPGALPDLESLSVAQNDITAASFGRLTAATYWPQLIDLNLLGNPLSGADWSLLPAGGRLLRLNLSGTDVGDDDLRRLADWPGLASLHTLNLISNRVTDAGLKRFLGRADLAGLRHLDLRSNPTGVAGLRVLADSDVAGRLDGLYVSLDHLTTRTARAVIRKGALDRLGLFGISGSRRDENAVRDLAEHFGPALDLC